jgi:flavin reductase (DIM6/NTAB) family NADH-FMN oxidoreductase RutF
MDERRMHTADIEALESRVRVNLINSLSGFKSACLVGTADGRGFPNLALFSSVVHIGADPPLQGMIVRPTSVPRHSYENIRATGCWTLNHVRRSFHEAAHRTSARFPREVSEFEACGFTPLWEEGFAAPFVAEAKIRAGLEFVEEHPLGNGTILVIGRVVQLVLPERCLSEDGYLDVEIAGTVAISGLDSYHETRRLSRQPYAKASGDGAPKDTAGR